jgi:hypothetical protein
LFHGANQTFSARRRIIGAVASRGSSRSSVSPEEMNLVCRLGITGVLSIPLRQVTQFRALSVKLDSQFHDRQLTESTRPRIPMLKFRCYPKLMTDDLGGKRPSALGLKVAHRLLKAIEINTGALDRRIDCCDVGRRFAARTADYGESFRSHSVRAAGGGTGGSRLSE